MNSVSSSLHAGYRTTLLRRWQCTDSRWTPDNLVYPVFISEKCNAMEDIASLPGQKRVGLNVLDIFLHPLMEKGLNSVLLFGVIDAEHKDSDASYATSDAGVVVKAVKLLKLRYPELTVMCDVCLCGYTDHGHCGILHSDGSIAMEETLERLADMSKQFALAGEPVVLIMIKLTKTNIRRKDLFIAWYLSASDNPGAAVIVDDDDDDS